MHSEIETNSLRIGSVVIRCYEFERMGVIEVTRFGRREPEMDLIADFMAHLLVEKQSPDQVVEDVIEFRQGYQTLNYDFDQGLPPQ